MKPRFSTLPDRSRPRTLVAVTSSRSAAMIPRCEARLEALLLIDQADRDFLERPAQGVAAATDDSESREGPGPADRPLQAPRSDRRGGVRQGLHGRAAPAGAPHGRAQDHQAGHGHPPGRRPVRIRAPGPRPDEPPQYRPDDRRRRDRDRAGPTSSWSWSGAYRSPNSATRITRRPKSGSSSLSRCATPSSTRTTRASSIATSSRRT